MAMFMSLKLSLSSAFIACWSNKVNHFSCLATQKCLKFSAFSLIIPETKPKVFFVLRTKPGFYGIGTKT